MFETEPDQNMTSSSHIEKLKKLLSLAQSDNEHERDMALAKASAFATQHNIDLASIDPGEVGVIKQEEIIQDDYAPRVYRRRPPEHHWVSAILRNHFSVELVWGWRGEWHFIGTRENTGFAKWLCAYLLEEFSRRWDYYRKTEMGSLAYRDTLRYKNTFLYGIYEGLSEKLKAEKKATEEKGLADKPAEVRERYALVVQDEKARRESAKNTFFPHLTSRARSVVSIRSHGVLDAGRASGRTINCSRPLAA